MKYLLPGVVVIGFLAIFSVLMEVYFVTFAAEPPTQHQLTEAQFYRELVIMEQKYLTERQQNLIRELQQNAARLNQLKLLLEQKQEEKKQKAGENPE